MFLAVQQIDPNVPTNIQAEDLTAWTGVLDQILGDILTPATPVLLQDGVTLWRLLAIIMVMWTGLKVAYSGSLAPWDLVRLFIGLWFPWIMLLFYADPIPGTAFSFPQTITAGGNWLGQTFQSDAVAVLTETLTTLISNYQARFAAAWADLSVFGLLTSGSSALFTFVMGAGALGVLIIALILIFAVTMGQVVWAMVAIAILIFLGPMFIPWLMVPPLAFLFWGWFRALITYSLYSVIAGVLLRVWGGIAAGYITTLSNTDFSFSSLGWLALWYISVIPLLVASILSALKVGELASTIVGGGGGGGSGALGLVGSAMAVKGGGRLASSAARTGGAGV